jgi:hypothetical protein
MRAYPTWWRRRPAPAPVGIFLAHERLKRDRPRKDMRRLELNPWPLGEQRDIAEVIDDTGAPRTDICLWSAAALAQVCRGIITGEGPTACGRVHFSRTIDRQDTALCARLLVAAGRYGDAVSRVEADALLDIHAVASDRQDGGQFDDLLTKAVVHHVMSASGLNVPRRDCAVDSTTPLARWASRVRMDAQTTTWLQARLAETHHASPAAKAIFEALAGTEPTSGPMIGAKFDLAA